MNLEQQKKQARELLRAIRAGNPGALTRLRTRHLRWAHTSDETIRQEAALHDAQFVVAREQGFPGWTRLKAFALSSTHPRHTRLFVPDLKWLADRVHGLLRTRQSAGPAALEHIREWHPRFANSTDAEILAASFTESDARLVYAREHGFDTWDDLTLRVHQLASAPNPEAAEPFLAAFRALESRNDAALQSLLARHPDLVGQRGTNGNSLLNLAVSLGSENAIELLLTADANVNDANDRGWTPLHQAAYSNQPSIAAALIAHGAGLDAEAHGAGGTPLIAALFWGHREVADLLGRHSIAPGNLRVAAGLGRPDLLEQCFTAAGDLAPEASAARVFYRPHSGFPDWQPSSDPQQILDEALVWAAKSGRTEVLPRLIRAGARLDADPYRGTPLIWTASRNRIETAEWLLDHCAPINQKATFGGLTHGQGVTALHMAAQNGHLAMVQMLIRRGADPTLRDDLYNGTAEGAANHFGQTAVRDYLRGIQSPDEAKRPHDG